MKRKFLEDLGLEKEQVDSIMAEHGKSIKADADVIAELEELKTTAETLQNQLTERDNDLEELKTKATSSEDLEEKLAELQEKYTAETEAHKAELEKQRKLSEIKLGVIKAGARNEKAVMALLDSEQIKVNDDGVHGLKEQLEALSESDPYLFDTGNEPSGQSTVGGNPNRKTPTETNAFEVAKNKIINR